MRQHFKENNNEVTDGYKGKFMIPKLDLPIFSGKYKDWENCDLFTTLVDYGPRIAEATKLQYLKTCLRDSAADLVKDVVTTNANYKTTWQALKARLHNPRLIVFNRLRAFFDLQPLKKESASELTTLVDEAQRIVRALTNLKMPVEHWHIWFVFILTARLDPEPRKAWETELCTKDRRVTPNPNLTLPDGSMPDGFPKFFELAEFLENRARTLSMIAAETKRTDKRPAVSTKPQPCFRKTFHASSSADGRPTCPMCFGPHRLYKCYKFKGKGIAERRTDVRRLKLCYNCFGSHRATDCPSSARCLQCREKHHSLIHADDVKPDGTKEAKADATSKVNVHTASIVSREVSVILATAQVTLVGVNGEHSQVRALLDQGSESSFISTSIAKLLGLSMRNVDIRLTGLSGRLAGSAHAAVIFTMRSLVYSTFELEVEALVHPKLTSRLPSRSGLKIDTTVFTGLQMADSHFYVPDSIDVILGADVYGRLLRPGLRRLPRALLTLHDTALVWVVSGPIGVGASRRADAPLHTLHCTSEKELDETLTRFWNLEEVLPPIESLSPSEQICENLFKDGRFAVRLPLRSEPPKVSKISHPTT